MAGTVSRANASAHRHRIGAHPGRRRRAVDARDAGDPAASREGHEVVGRRERPRRDRLLNQRPFDLVVSDARMPDLDGLEVLRHARSINPSVIAIMVTAYGSPDLMRGVAQLGVNDYVEKPFNTEVLRFRIRKELDRKRLQQENVLLKRAMHSANQFDNIIGNSSAMLQVFEMVETDRADRQHRARSPASRAPARSWSRAPSTCDSPRSDRPFVAVNCGALSETLLDSELFGHMRGSFTGADANRKGLIEVADKGTIFLDEIGEMSPMLQVKVLRVLQERKFRRVGGTDEVEADIRIIAATNRDLGEDGRGGAVPRRPLLPDQRDSGPAAGAARARRRHPAARRALRGEVRRADEEERHRHFGRGPGAPHGATPGPATCASSKTRWSAPSPSSGRRRSSPRAFRSRSGRGHSGPVAALAAHGGPPRTTCPKPASTWSSTSSISSASTSRKRSAGQAGVKVKAAELLGMSFRSFRYYMKKYNLK